MQASADLKSIIRNKAIEIGFDACGFAEAQKLEKESYRLEEWLEQGRHASMNWMSNHFEKRTDPTLLVPGSRTVISVLSSYYHPDQKELIGNKKDLLIAKYAQGRDYHKVVKKNLRNLFQFIDELTGGLQGRYFVDSAPVLDKAWAVRSGLGWIGKNSNLLNKNTGSYFFIGEIICDLKLDPDQPVSDHCGSCTRCIDSCPTNAIYEPYRVDASKCISYHTIEHKGALDPEYENAMENWIFGCDICQDVCPWNSKSITANFPDLHPRKEILDMSKEDWFLLGKKQFDKIFEGSPVKRTGYQGLKRNIKNTKF
ncbi:tRNA epoxyqueuosine(34) reductase QueG [Balneola sp. MJW-20]|uniref:tRNA epoxyqueuosine(34) reductase QueG n=1 Tax=Gracilimonas aurantiaca TaxID=3234185 RepID=UPI003466157E